MYTLMGNRKLNSCIRPCGDVLFLNIKVLPGASKSELGEVKESSLKIRIAAVPEDGKANKELLSFLAKLLNLPKKDIILASGEKSRNKILRLPVSAKEKLEELIDKPLE